MPAPEQLTVYTLLALFLTGCSTGTTGPPPPESRPDASALRSFGDPPLESQLRLVPPPTGETAWEYVVDLDADGAPDETGTLHAPVNIDFSFTEPGVHPILVSFSAGVHQVRDTVYAIVNDHDAYEIIASKPVERFPDIEGLSFWNFNLFTTAGAVVHKRTFDTFSITDSLLVGDSLSSHRDLQGLSLSPSDKLYATDKASRWVLEIEPSTVALLRQIPVPEVADFLIDASQEGRLYVGGPLGIAVVDLEQGVLTERRFHGRYFDVSSRAIAFITGTDPPELFLLDTTTLETILAVPLRFSPHIVAFSSSSSTVYILGLTEKKHLSFTAIDGLDGSVQRSMVLEPCPGCFSGIGVGLSASAQLQEGFTVMASPSGGFVIDESLHLPVLKLGSPEHPDTFLCCDVVRGGSPNELYFNTSAGLKFLQRVIVDDNLDFRR